VSKYQITLVISLLLIICSCQSDKDLNIPTYNIVYADFKNTLRIDGFVEPVRSTTAACPPYIEGTIGSLVEDGTYVKEGDVVCTIEVQSIQVNYDQSLIELENLQAHLNKTKADLNLQYTLLEAQVKNNNADAEIAQLDSLQLKYSTQNQTRIKELELEKVAIEKTKYEKKLQALSIIQQSEIRRIELEIQRLSFRVKSLKDQLDALTIKAPKDGLAIRANNPITQKKFQIGDPVWHLMPIVTLPELDEMKVKINAPEIDYKQININDSIAFTFDALPGNLAWGKINMKSPVGQQYREGSKVKFFEIEASIDSILAMPEPGLTANCTIILTEVKDTIVIPQIAVFEEDSIKAVYIKVNNGFEMRQIKTGLASAKEVIISDGLQAGEVIVLAKPTPTSIKRKTLLPESLEEEPVETEENEAETELNE